MHTYIERYENTWLTAMYLLDADEDDRLGLILEDTAMVLYNLAHNK